MTRLEEDLARVFEWCFEQDALLSGLTDTLEIGNQFTQLGFDDHVLYINGIVSGILQPALSVRLSMYYDDDED